MARISGKSETFFRLNPADADKAKCFAVRRGEIKGRSDVNFWRCTPLFRELYSHSKFPNVTIGEISKEIQYGCSLLAQSEPTGVPILRMNNLQNDGWDLSDIKYVKTENDNIKQYQLDKGDLLFNRTNSKELVGKCEVFEENQDWIFASYLIRVRLDFSRAIPRFVSNFLSTSAGRLQIDRLSRQIIGMTNINAEELREIIIPLPPDLKTQAKLVGQMDAACEQRRKKLADADALLADIDTFLLKTLGISQPKPDDRKVFAVLFKFIHERADADFHSPHFCAIREGIEKGKYPAKPLFELCSDFESGFAAGKQDQAFDYETGIPHLRPLNLSVEGELSLDNTKFIPKSSVPAGDYCRQQEVLFNNTNSAEMVGKSCVFELEQSCVCSNHMTRLQTTAETDPYYLAALFNMFRRLGYFSLLATKFNNQAGINLDTLKPLRVPAPPLPVQTAIAAEARRRRETARQLRAEAETLWQTAKQRFEEQLLGVAKP